MFADNSRWPFVINLANGIIGVSVLAMPFCLERCGIVLGFVLLTACVLFTRFTCKLLIDGAFLCKRTSYEQYGQQALGPWGKTVVEICLILYTKVTLIAFFVVIGDLGENVFGSLFIGPSDDLNGQEQAYAYFRIIFVVAFAFLVVLPLCLLKNIKSLSFISSLAVLFYGFLIGRLVITSLPHMFSAEAWIRVNFWRWEGVLQCLPIFSMSLSCHTQLFIISNEMPDSNPPKMNSVITSAVVLCSSVYFSVGLFGYLAFYDKSPIPGDVMVLLEGSLITQAIKLGFLLSVAVSYPIMIFPCRAAVYSMVKTGLKWEKSSSHVSLMELNLDDNNSVPPYPSKLITFFLISSNLVISLIFPNMELILGLSGSLIGSMVCFVLPALLYIKASSLYSKKQETSLRLYRLSQLCLLIGILMLICCSYATLMEHHNEHSFVDGHIENDAASLAKKNFVERSKRSKETGSVENSLIDDSVRISYDASVTIIPFSNVSN